MNELENARGLRPQRKGWWLWALISVPLAVAAQAPAPRADRIFVNGKI